jgi:hypothetical protein
LSDVLEDAFDLRIVVFLEHERRSDRAASTSAAGLVV